MRLCYIANPNSIHTQRWLHYFAAADHEIHLISDRIPQTALPPGVVLHDLASSFNLRKLRYVVWSAHVYRLVRQIGPDILHSHFVASAGWLGAAAAYHPFMVTAWGSDLLVAPGRSWAQRQLARWVLGRADYVTCVSDPLAEAALALGAKPERLEVAHWGIDTSIFQPGVPGTRLREELGLGPGPIVLSIRAMQAKYNPLDIARAIPTVLENVPSAQFIIRTYGADPALLADFQRIVRNRNADASVHYVGDLPDDRAIADLYRLGDIAISVPPSDGTPLSVLEAMACGAVPVLSDLPSLREWVDDGIEGLFVPVGNPEAIGSATTRLLTDDSLQRRMAANCNELIRQRADREVWMRRYEEIYHRLLEKANPNG